MRKKIERSIYNLRKICVEKQQWEQASRAYVEFALEHYTGINMGSSCSNEPRKAQEWLTRGMRMSRYMTYRYRPFTQSPVITEMLTQKCSSVQLNLISSSKCFHSEILNFQNILFNRNYIHIYIYIRIYCRKTLHLHKSLTCHICKIK